jgi:hypothetical protein
MNKNKNYTIIHKDLQRERGERGALLPMLFWKVLDSGEKREEKGTTYALSENMFPTYLL